MTVPGSHGSASYHLLAALLKLAPNADAQAAASAMFNDLVAEHSMNEDEVISELVIHLHDGFNYDTWPWGEGSKRQA